jgi:RsiW-degrading membrane proteinase PrsW (M82 family)
MSPDVWPLAFEPGLALALGLAVAPAALVFWWLGKTYGPGPVLRILALAFGLGMLAALPLTVIAPAIDAAAARLLPGWDEALRLSLFAAAWPEELVRALVLGLVYARASGLGRSPAHRGVLLGVFVSFGLATFETMLYAVVDGPGAPLVRLFTAMPCHVALGAIMGAYLSQARSGRGLLVLPLCKAVAVPVLLHTLYDYSLLADDRLTPDGGRGALWLTGLVLFLLLAWTRELARALEPGAQKLSG